MKKILFVLLVIFVVGSCKKEASLDEGPPFLNFAQGQESSVYIDSETLSYTIRFSTNSDWHVISSDSWLSANPFYGGAGDHVIELQFEENRSYGKRKAKITFNSDYLPQSINVTQKAKENYEIHVDPDGGSITAPVPENVGYSIRMDKGCSSWIRLADDTGGMTFFVDSNSSEIVREGIIRLTPDDGSPTHVLKVVQNALDYSAVDGFMDPEGGVVLLQEATIGNGTDLFIMGDGFAASQENFGSFGKYDRIMRQAYSDFFSIEPVKSFKPYFNVYYIKAVSMNDHDAVPHPSNGAAQGSANTVFSSEFTNGSPSVRGNDDMVFKYATQALKAKGASGGRPLADEDEIHERVMSSVSLVMINVNCYSGTCWLYGDSSLRDYCKAPSVAYVSLDTIYGILPSITVHEAAGHGLGRLADEYGSGRYNSFSVSVWDQLDKAHREGWWRNVNEYYVSDAGLGYTGDRSYTTKDNVYWSELLDESLPYVKNEGLGIYEGGNGYGERFCRSTSNSVMNSYFRSDGRHFNAISRWELWYRTMKLTGMTDAASFEDSLDEFLAFDRTLNIKRSVSETKTIGVSLEDINIVTAPPVIIEGEWINGRYVVKE